MKNIFLTISLFILSILSFAQEKPTLKFNNDSVLIGEPTPVSFSYRHNKNLDVLFPDSTFNFTPFEYEYREIFNTETDSLSTDSCVYYLSTFELDKVQTLKLPVFIFNKKDSIPVYSNEDNITLTEVITTISDTLKIKENANFVKVSTDFNSLLFSIILTSILVILLVLGILFKNKIILFFRIRKLKKANEKFEVTFNEAVNNYLKSATPNNLEKTVTIWKSYIEKTTAIPYTKLSTKEIQEIIEDQSIIELLKTVDGELFGGIKQKEYDFNELNKFANSMFNQKMNELQND